ncbi:MAG: ferredoxin [Candidatus Shapirobacteria bacterium]|jgi:ferredoxin|nr:ferredoxin [Candidatus Shapirobacteria bacterium]
MTKISLDQNKCIGCNTCPLMDPETFEMDTTIYKAKIKKQPTEITDAVKSAIEACPVGAITIDEN